MVSRDEQGKKEKKEKRSEEKRVVGIAKVPCGVTVDSLCA